MLGKASGAPPLSVKKSSLSNCIRTSFNVRVIVDAAM